MTATLLPPPGVKTGTKKVGGLKPVGESKPPQSVPAKPAEFRPSSGASKGKDFYAARPAFIGAQVWYCRIDFAGNYLETMPGILFSRNLIEPDLWTVAVMAHPSSVEARHDIPFSETPANGCWTWPVIPQMPVEKPAENPPA